MPPIWLNIDLGELDGEPAELLELADGANIACGGHAGSEASMRDLVRRSLSLGRRIGAHPSYPDRESFGRRSLELAPDAVVESVSAQLERLRAVIESEGAQVDHVKLHGALYHDADRNDELARRLVARAKRVLATALWVGPAKGALARAARAEGVDYAREGFADRGVRTDGSLIPRGEPGALITDPDRVAERVRAIVRSGEIDTICVHGDSPGAVAIARAARRALDATRGS